MDRRPTTPPLFSPTHRPMLATSASFRRDSSHQSRGPSSALPDTDDPWRGIDSPKQVTRSVSEGTPTSTPWSKGSEILSSRKGFSGSITSVEEDVFTVSDHRAAMDVTNPLGDPTVVIHIPPVLIPSTPNSKGKGKAKDVDRPNLFRSVSVLASMVETSNGRDKVLVGALGILTGPYPTRSLMFFILSPPLEMHSILSEDLSLHSCVNRDFS